MIGEEQNRVIVRIWTSKYNKTFQGEDIGHVSIEIPSLHTPEDPAYYSFWPDLINREWVGYIHPVPGFYMKGYQRPLEITPPLPHQMPEYDVDAEERPAEVVFCFYCLDINEMQKKFKEIQSQGVHWVAIGKNIVKMNTRAYSCASLARDLLIAGGISEFLPPSSSWPSHSSSQAWSSAPIPDNFVSILHGARERERALNPRVSRYQFENETPTQHTARAKTTCTLQ